ncbi:MAG: hypothetical protein PHT31_00990 [Candidatus Omnitrophica bacterium]|nr:hypothetical protein [Candidatus Omnitrophota bacterium]
MVQAENSYLINYGVRNYLRISNYARDIINNSAIKKYADNVKAVFCFSPGKAIGIFLASAVASNLIFSLVLLKKIFFFGWLTRAVLILISLLLVLEKPKSHLLFSGSLILKLVNSCCKKNDSNLEYSRVFTLKTGKK